MATEKEGATFIWHMKKEKWTRGPFIDKMLDTHIACVASINRTAVVIETLFWLGIYDFEAMNMTEKWDLQRPMMSSFSFITDTSCISYHNKMGQTLFLSKAFNLNSTQVFPMTIYNLDSKLRKIKKDETFKMQQDASILSMPNSIFKLDNSPLIYMLVVEQHFKADKTWIQVHQLHESQDSFSSSSIVASFELDVSEIEHGELWTQFHQVQTISWRRIV